MFVSKKNWLIVALLQVSIFSFAQKDVKSSENLKLIPVPKLKLPHAVESVSWNVDDSLFAYSENKNITIRKAKDYSIFQTILSDVSVNSQDFAGVTASDDHSNQLITFNEDNSIFIRRLPEVTPTIERRLDESYVISKYAFSRNGNYVAIGTESGVIELGQQLYYTNEIITQKLEGHTQKIYDLAFSPNRQYLASVSLDGTIKIWRTSTRQLEHELSQNCPPPQYIPVCFTADSKAIISARNKRLIEIRDFKGNELRLIKTRQDIVSMGVTGNGKYIIVLTNLNQFQYYSIETKEMVKYIPAWNKSPVTCYKFSNDEKYLLLGHSDGSIYILDLNEVLYFDGEVPPDYKIVSADEKEEQVFSPVQLEKEIKEKYVIEDDEIEEAEYVFTGHNIDFRLQGIYAINKYYNWGGKIDVAYINDRLFEVCYVGAKVSPLVLFPNKKKYPYEYRLSEYSINPPYFCELGMSAFLGKIWNPWNNGWVMYTEGFIGGAFAEIMSPTLGNGKLNTALLGGISCGFSYGGFHFDVSASYDSAAEFIFGAGFGYKVRITVKNKNYDAEKPASEAAEETVSTEEKPVKETKKEDVNPKYIKF